MIESVVLSQLIYNEEYQRKVLPYLRADYFTDEGDKVVFGLVDHFINEYRKQPTLEAIGVMISQSKLNEFVYNKAVESLETLSAAPQNLEWLISSTEKWAKERAVYRCIEDAVQIYESPDKLEKMATIPQMLEEALSVKFDSYLGHIYWEMAGQHYDVMNQEDSKLPFDIEIFNKATRGGVVKKSLNLYVGAINAGKTTALIHTAAMYAEQGKNVFVFTLEVAEDQWRHRLDARILRKPFDYIEKMERDQYIRELENLRRNGDKFKGDIIIKEYPSGTGHVGFYRKDIKEYEQRTGKKIDVIVIDYLGESASARLPIHLMANTNIYYTSVAREFRALSFEFDAPVWSALQFNREKQNSTDGEISDIADAIGIPKVADFIMAFFAPDDLASVNKARANVQKNRYANKQKLKSFLFGMDQDRQIMFDLDPDEVKQDLSEKEVRYINSVELKNDFNASAFGDNEAKSETVANWKI